MPFTVICISVKLAHTTSWCLPCVHDIVPDPDTESIRGAQSRLIVVVHALCMAQGQLACSGLGSAACLQHTRGFSYIVLASTSASGW
jgi:hypothetical protein